MSIYQFSSLVIDFNASSELYRHLPMLVSTSVFTNTNIHSATYFSDTFCFIIVEIIVFREGTSVRSSRRSTVYTCDSTAAFTQLAAALPSVARAAAT